MTEVEVAAAAGIIVLVKDEGLLIRLNGVYEFFQKNKLCIMYK